MGLSKRQVYTWGSGAGAMGRLVETGLGFASVWLLVQLLSKPAYGRWVVALAIIELGAVAASAGLDRVVLYRGSRESAPAGELAGHRYTGSALGFGLLGGLAAALGLIALAEPAAVLMDQPDAAPWLRMLVPLIPLRVGLAICTAWQQSRQRIPQAIWFGRILPTALGVGTLGSLWFSDLGPAHAAAAAAAALVLARLIALGVAWGAAPVAPRLAFGAISRAELGYGLKLMGTGLLRRGIRSMDVLMLGLLAPAALTADYAVAASLAIGVLAVHEILSAIFAPRAGALHARGEGSELAHEFEQTRSLAFLGALLPALVLAALADPVLALFGDFAAARPVLLLLLATFVLQASFGMTGVYLNMAGYAGWSLAATGSLLTLNLCLNLWLIPLYGARGAALATLASVLGSKVFTSLVILRLDRFATWSFELAATAGAAAALLGAGALDLLPPGPLAAGLAMLVALTALRRRGLWQPELARLLARRRAPGLAGGRAR